MATPNRWVRNPKNKNDWKKQYYRHGRWIDVKPNYFTFNRLPWIIDSARRRPDAPHTKPPHYYPYPYNVTPLRYSLIRITQRLWEYISEEMPLGPGQTQDDKWKVFASEVLGVIQSDSELFKEIWRQVTLQLVAIAIREIPVPEGLEGFKEILYQFFDWFADKFSELLFKVKL